MPRAITKDRFQLALYINNQGDAKPLADLLSKVRRGLLDRPPYLGQITLLLESAGRRWWESHASIGDLARIAAQVDVAQQRLAAGQIALVRSAVDDGHVGGYFLFEPIDDATVHISMLAIDDPSFSYRYPVGRDGRPVEALYAYVEPRIAELKRPVSIDFAEGYFAQAPFERATLLRAMAREARLGREMYEVLGVEYFLEWY